VVSSLSSSSELPNGKEKDKGTPRLFLSNVEVEILTRNVEDILLLHELFVSGLREAVAPFGFRMTLEEGGGDDPPPVDRIDAAIRAVATKFTTEVDLFFQRGFLRWVH